MEKGPPKLQCSFSLKRLFDIDSEYPAKKRKVPISLSRSRNRNKSSSQQSQQSQLVDVKPEPLSQQTPLNTVKNDTDSAMNEELKLEESIYSRKEKLEAKQEPPLLCNIKDEPSYEVIPLELDTQESTTNKSSKQQKLEEYACPICNQDLSHVKSSYLRQQHVEECITGHSEPEQEESTAEFNDCVFCGKNISHFNSNQRQVHINACLDAADDLEKQYQASMFAGQHVPFLNTLEICPVCHEFGPFNNRTLKQKIVHVKQCAKQNKLSIPQLLKKFQWIGWGHAPVPSAVNTTTAASIIPDSLSPLKMPKHQLVAFIDDDMDDNDFSDKVIVHSTRIPETNTRQQDKLDEELQTALAISKSLKQQPRRKQRITISDERDWNAANIWSSEDSKMNAMTRLDEILFPTSELYAYQQAEREKSNGLLGPSRIIPSHTRFFWDLTHNNHSNWHDPLVFTSFFLRKPNTIEKT